ncbi:hypothetical protein D3C81_1110530 [compost metagenome]
MMKREEITVKWDGMTARERDAWVALRIMNQFVVGGNVVRDECGFYPVPHYSTDISAAWPIMERYWSVELARLPGVVDMYGARINDSEGQVRAMTQKQTAPEALCLAALIVELTEDSADVAV